LPGDPLPRFGAGIALRRLSVSDLAAFQAYRSDPELGRYQGWSPMSEPEARAFLEEMNGVPLFRPGEQSPYASVTTLTEIAAPQDAT
jgi:hypothetical protein